jgi:hypothetical protein
MKEKRFGVVKDGNTTKIKITAVDVATPSQVLKLESMKIRPAIMKLAEDFHIKWALESSDERPLLAISRIREDFDSTNIRKFEQDVHGFVSALDKLIIPAESEKPETIDFKPEDALGKQFIVIPVGPIVSLLVEIFLDLISQDPDDEHSESDHE